MKVDLFQDEVYVFTPKGDVRVFPRGATPIDFAYQIHTQLGDHVTGARINGKMEPLRYKLRNGDVVEVLTKPDQHPSKDWLDFVGHDARAVEDPQLPAPGAARQEPSAWARSSSSASCTRPASAPASCSRTRRRCGACFEALKVQNQEELFVSIGYGKIDPEEIVKLVAPPDDAGATRASRRSQLREGRIAGLVRKVIKRDEGAIRINGIDDVLVRYAKCCNPLPGDDILGFITRGRGVTIHRRGCPKAFDTDPERRVEITVGQPARASTAACSCAWSQPTSRASSRTSARRSWRRGSTSARPTAARATTGAR